MNLSEAILRGSKDSVQTFGVYFQGEKGRDVLGAAMVGAGFPGPTFLFDFQTRYALPLKKAAHCPEGCGIGADVETVAIHLNDDHKRSREEIAAWLEALGL